jgi:hypothetical protein
MDAGYFLLGGGMWFSKSKHAAMNPGLGIGGVADVLGSPIHAIVAAKGFNLDPQNWPKPGLFCQNCLTVTIHVRQ